MSGLAQSVQWAEPGEEQRHDSPVFAYVGRTALTVTGGATGRQYRFTAPGALATVDGRDAPSMRQVALLRSVVRAE